MPEQAGFSFDAPLETIPASQLPPKPERPDEAAFTERLRTLLPNLPDDICLDDLLLAAGLPSHALTGWHRARALDVLLVRPPVFQAYVAGDNGHGGKLFRYRRLPPLEPCPGFDDETCETLTRGGVRCDRHAAMEDEALWNHE